jgi:uncharacterized protein (DUF736 family)
MDYSKENTGVLFKNDQEGNERRPMYTGTWTDADGNELRLAAWIKTSKSGNKYFSLQATEKKQAAPVRQQAPTNVQNNAPDFDDPLPF